MNASVMYLRAKTDTVPWLRNTPTGQRVARTIHAGTDADTAPTAAVRAGLRIDALVAMVQYRAQLPYRVVVPLLDAILPHLPATRRYWEWSRLVEASAGDLRACAASAVVR